jgi:hypothetical protein
LRQDITPNPSAPRPKHLPFLPIELLDEVLLRLRATESLTQQSEFHKLAEDLQHKVAFFCK